MRLTWLSTGVIVLASVAASAARAQDPVTEPEPAGDVDADVPGDVDVDGDGVPDAAAPGSLEERVAALEQEVDDLREEADRQGDWVIRLRAGYFNLDHRPEPRLFPTDRDDDEGWAVGVDLFAPLWGARENRRSDARRRDRERDRDDRDDGDRFDDDDDDVPVELYMRLSLDYRHLGNDETTGLGGREGTLNYLDVLLAPTLRFPIGDVVVPYVFTGLDIVIADPGSSSGSGTDLGYVAGVGIEFRVHPRIGVGTEYRHTWFGVADLEDEDYHQVDGFVSFYF